MKVGSFLCLMLCLYNSVDAGKAPNLSPELPDGFCPKSTGDITATTGECMCSWQAKEGCQGSGCEYAYGLSWYHHSCKDCRCMPEPKR
mmetsp:Transcript_31262/g.30114  ORF Transcript_31262/g.30114 Transcript_31262/m.30114 type:complete len:88 (-) Transcript_31262:188-451(-)